MPEHDVELVAFFIASHYLTVLSSDNTRGTVSGSGYYKTGREVTVTLEYIFGTFKGWYNSDDVCVSTDNPYTFTMPDCDYTLTAVFRTQAEEDEIAWKKSHGVIPVLDSINRTITYGIYPQTHVNDQSLIAELDSLTDPSPINGWYYYEREYYAKVDATPYTSSYLFEDGTTIVSGTTYWFKCEPITWKILSNTANSYYLLSEQTIDKHCYCPSVSSRTIDGTTIYLNNYQYSEIRAWLNGLNGSSYSVSNYSGNGFYQTAFRFNNSYIQTTVVDNSASTTDSNSNKFACSNTTDKVFLPSYKDYINNSYGFSTSTSSSNTRYGRTTDYLRAVGGYYNNAENDYRYCDYYWTRSPSSSSSGSAWYVNADGSLSNKTTTFGVPLYVTAVGIRPAITLVVNEWQ